MRVLLLLFCLALRAQDNSALKETALGRVVADEIRRSTTPVESPVIQAYVAQLGARLAAQFPDRGVPYSFEVVGMWSSMRAPRVLPGGYIFVPLDLFAAANDESEFAGMLAQAIARAARLGDDRPIFLDTQGIVVPLSLLPKVRAMELEADAAAAPAMLRAGFDPTALLRYIERMQTPPADQRIAALEEVLQALPATASVSSDAFLSIRQVGETQRDTLRPALKRR